MTKQKEIWRDIEGYEGKYQVSNLGRVKSLNFKNTNQEKILKQQIVHNGYLEVALFKNCKYCFRLIHRLVAQVFIPNPDNKPQVNHKNGIKTDNRVINLEWCTRSENIKHAYDTKLLKANRGQDSSAAKLTNEQAKKIRDEYIPYDKNKNTYALARKYRVSQPTIQKIVSNKRYK